jgi:hypothetical protein
MDMPVPDLDPKQRDPASILPADSYRPTTPIWVHLHGAWRPGIIESASVRAATVTYRPTGSRGTAVDTVTASYLLTRTDPDPLLDQNLGLGQAAASPAGLAADESLPRRNRR